MINFDLTAPAEKKKRRTLFDKNLELTQALDAAHERLKTMTAKEAQFSDIIRAAQRDRDAAVAKASDSALQAQIRDLERQVAAASNATHAAKMKCEVALKMLESLVRGVRDAY